MFLFSGTFFPIETLPAWAQHVAAALPLTHLVDMVRSLSYGEMNSRLLWDLTYLAVFGLVFFTWALRKMRARLIK
jgi:lipooligosaccharide transport system permease protein